MDLDDLLADQERVLDGPAGLAWQLSPVRGAAAAGRRVDLVLALLQQVDAAVLICDDDPAADGDQPGEWPQLAEGQWRLPDVPLDLGELLDWLCAGTWQLVGFRGEPRPVPLVDLFGEVQDSASALQQAGATWALDFFHDDEPWRLYCAPGLSSGA